MMCKKVIGIVGQGFVGTAVREGLCCSFRVATYDVKDKHHIHFYGAGGRVYASDTLGIDKPGNRLVLETDGPIFVCVPTPMFGDGSCDTSIVDRVMFDLDCAAADWDRHIVVILKSTVPPGTTERYNVKYKNIQVCFNPEFLREVSPNEDFAKQDRIILGGGGEALEQARHVFEKAFPSVPIYAMKSGEAEMVKYVTNVFLATKVSLANEISQICKKVDVDYKSVWGIASLDKRLSESHWMVPGPDGHHGFGGSCFPKDLNSLMRVALDNGVDPMVMRAVWKKNLEVRPERDWEQLIGRAVVDAPQ